jgi:hypothetical protein
MNTFRVLFGSVLLVISVAFPAGALDDTNYGTRLEITIPETSPENPVWSPDGSAIAFTDLCGGSIFTVPISGGEPTIVYCNYGKKIGFRQEDGGGMVVLGFTPDGTEIIFRDDMIDPERGGYAGPYDFPPSPQYPNGYHVDFAVMNPIFVIRSVNIETGVVRTFVDEAMDGEMSPNSRYIAYTWIASGADFGK